MSRIAAVSQIDKNGEGYISVFVEEPYINENGLWEGGKCLSFENNFKKNICKVFPYYWSNGMSVGFDKVIAIFKEETLSERECLAYADKLYKEK